MGRNVGDASSPTNADGDGEAPSACQQNDAGIFPREAAHIFYHICSPTSHALSLSPPAPDGGERCITDGEKNAAFVQGEAAGTGLGASSPASLQPPNAAPSRMPEIFPLRNSPLQKT